MKSPEGDRRGRRPRARRRPGFGLAISAASMAAGGGYFAAARLTSLGRLMHVSLPQDGLFLLIITAGIVAIILGSRVIVYFERRDQHRHEIISGMRGRKDVYQEYEDSSSRYVSWPITAATRTGESLRRPRPPQPQAGKAGHGDVVPLDRHQQVVSGTRPESSIADPAEGIPPDRGHLA